MVEGPVTLTGIIHATDPGAVPGGFPAGSGVMESMELGSLARIGAEPGGAPLAPAPERFQQTFRPIGECPAHVGNERPSHSSQARVTGVVLHVELASTAVRGGTAEAGLDSWRSFGADGSPIRLRIFPDYANTVLWLFGPVPCTDAALSPELAADMAAWEESHYASLDSNESWKSASGAAQFTASGRGLAERLAAELGGEFEVEFHSHDIGSRREVFHGGSAPGNPTAAAAFHGIVAAGKEKRVRLAALLSEGGVGFFAYAPLSAEVFNPGGIPPPDPYADSGHEE